jgi:hypothetical protein
MILPTKKEQALPTYKDIARTGRMTPFPVVAVFYLLSVVYDQPGSMFHTVYQCGFHPLPHLGFYFLSLHGVTSVRNKTERNTFCVLESVAKIHEFYTTLLFKFITLEQNPRNLVIEAVSNSETSVYFCGITRAVQQKAVILTAMRA